MPSLQSSDFALSFAGERTVLSMENATGNSTRCVPDEGRVALVAGLVMSSLGLIGLTLFTGRAPRPSQPFLQGDDSGVLADGYGIPADAHADPDEADARSANPEVI